MGSLRAFGTLRNLGPKPRKPTPRAAPPWSQNRKCDLLPRRCDVLVASDAIGMGLNLAIKRVVLTTLVVREQGYTQILVLCACARRSGLGLAVLCFVCMLLFTTTLNTDCGLVTRGNCLVAQGGPLGIKTLTPLQHGTLHLSSAHAHTCAEV